ncbi:hypothetical protein BKA66DRAFT_462648 [Pyrenochaeta sp. MPI-SDFR-AT-0127]|nr:hypothetical protein BKA66DRAFT_462648 [Pyrenochaeta sp. MPI-SDFR-AT-0127]
MDGFVDIPQRLRCNCPQVILSFTYFSIKRLCTGTCCAIKRNNFAQRWKPFRTSSPQSLQRFTHYLQLPWEWAVPLISVSGILHGLLSQSLFLVKINLLSPHQDDSTP